MDYFWYKPHTALHAHCFPAQLTRDKRLGAKWKRWSLCERWAAPHITSGEIDPPLGACEGCLATLAANRARLERKHKWTQTHKLGQGWAIYQGERQVQRAKEIEASGGLKLCLGCKKLKSRSDFRDDPRRRDGKYHTCKPCTDARVNRYKREKRESDKREKQATEKSEAAKP